jgi:hypothetical protein
MTISYAWGRYDTIGILLVSILTYGFIRADSIISLPLIAVSAALIPWAGINLVPYLFILAAAAVLTYGFTPRKQHYLLACTSIFLGLLFLYMLYATNGVAHRLIESAGGHGISDVVDKSSGINAGSFHDKVFWTLKHLPGIIFKRLSAMPNWYWMNKSYLLYCLVLLGFFFLTKKKLLTATKKDMTILKFCSLVVIAVPFALGILRNYPYYYTWMAVLPLCIVLPRFLMQINNTGIYYNAITWPLVLASLAVSFNSSFLPPKNNNQMKEEFLNTNEFLARYISKEDKVYSEFATYYGVMPLADYVLLPTYKDMVSPVERAELSALIATKENFPRTKEIWGGEWYEYARNCAKPPYNVSIYRRLEGQQEPSTPILNDNCK